MNPYLSDVVCLENCFSPPVYRINFGMYSIKEREFSLFFLLSFLLRHQFTLFQFNILQQLSYLIIPTSTSKLFDLDTNWILTICELFPNIFISIVCRSILNSWVKTDAYIPKSIAKISRNFIILFPASPSKVKRWTTELIYEKINAKHASKSATIPI